MLLEEVKHQTETVFDKKLVKPEAPVLWRDKIATYREAGLINQMSSAIFDMRCEQAIEIGFKRIESDEMVKMLMGEPHNKTYQSAERYNYEWMYNHHTDVEKLGVEAPGQWHGFHTFFEKIENVLLPSKWWQAYGSATEEKLSWQAIFGKLNKLKRTIPYGVVLKIQETKKLKLFNSFNVLAPREAWEIKTDIDPIIVATIWEIIPEENKPGSYSAGQVAHFFLAQW